MVHLDFFDAGFLLGAVLLILTLVGVLPGSFLILALLVLVPSLIGGVLKAMRKRRARVQSGVAARDAAEAANARHVDGL